MKRNREKREDRYLETNDSNWYKLCKKKVGWKQTGIDDAIKKDKAEQIKFNI